MDKKADLLANVKMAHKKIAITLRQTTQNKETLWYLSDLLYDVQKFLEDERTDK